MLDRNLHGEHFLTVGEELHELLAAGTVWEEIVNSFTNWLGSHPEERALEIAARFVAIGGRPDDVKALLPWPGDSSKYREAVMTDTSYLLARSRSHTA